MKTEMVTIPKAEYDKLKSLTNNVDWELVDDFKKGLEDLKQGKIEEYKKGSLVD